MTDVRNESLGLVVKPLLVAEEQKNDDHRSADEVVVKIRFQNSEPYQSLCYKVHVYIPSLVVKVKVSNLCSRCIGASDIPNWL